MRARECAKYKCQTIKLHRMRDVTYRSSADIVSKIHSRLFIFARTDIRCVSVKCVRRTVNHGTRNENANENEKENDEKAILITNKFLTIRMPSYAVPLYLSPGFSNGYVPL